MEVRFIALVSRLCKYYHWPPDFWRRMGRRQFYAWVDQVHAEVVEQHEQRPDSWKNTENDPFWQRAREKRSQSRGR